MDNASNGKSAAEQFLAPRKNEACQEYLLGKTYIVHHAGRKEISVLNETASLVFAKCDGEHTIYGIAESLAAIFPALDFETVLADVKEVLTGFINKGIVQSN